MISPRQNKKEHTRSVCIIVHLVNYLAIDLLISRTIFTYARNDLLEINMDITIIGNCQRSGYSAVLKAITDDRINAVHQNKVEPKKIRGDVLFYMETSNREQWVGVNL